MSALISKFKKTAAFSSDDNSKQPDRSLPQNQIASSSSTIATAHHSSRTSLLAKSHLSTVDEMSTEHLPSEPNQESSNSIVIEKHGKKTGKMRKVSDSFFTSSRKNSASSSLDKSERLQKSKAGSFKGRLSSFVAFGKRNTSSGSSTQNETRPSSRHSLRDSDSILSIHLQQQLQQQSQSQRSSFTSFSRLSGFFDKRSNGSTRAETPVDQVPQVLSNSKFRRTRNRGGSVSSAYQSSNSSVNSLYIGSRRFSNTQPLDSPRATLVVQDNYTRGSSSRGLNPDPKRYSDYSFDRNTEWDSVASGISQSARPSLSVDNDCMETLIDQPFRSSSDTANTPSSASLTKVQFELPNLIVTKPDTLDTTVFESSNVPNVPTVVESRKRTKSTSQFDFSSDPHSSAASSGLLPRSVSSTTVNEYLVPQVEPQPSSSSMNPLRRLKNRTVSRLFHTENLVSAENSDSEPSAAPHPINKSISSNSLTIPFPFVRSYSNENIPATSPYQPSSDVAPSTDVGRRRSRTLSSLDERSNTLSTPLCNSNSASSGQSPASFTGTRLADVDEVTSFSLEETPRPRKMSNPRKPPLSLRELSLLALPERDGQESPEEYLISVLSVGLESYTAGALSKYDDKFHKDTLRLYLKQFDFSSIPLDIALRKFLISVRLPAETQQIDRVLEAFAYQYYDCNPGIYLSPEDAYFITFSLMILHTDFFNKTVKYKMQKSDYFKSTQQSNVSKDVLSCFYDNITSVPFIHSDDEFNSLATKLSTQRRNSAFGRSIKDFVEPYSLILEDKVHIIRPDLGYLKSENPYIFHEIESMQDFIQLQDEFKNGKRLQLISQRSRPEAYGSLGNQAGPGVVDIKIFKAGFLFRPEGKKKNVWKEIGVILTSSQLFFFKDTNWFRLNIMNQKNIVPGTPTEVSSRRRNTVSDILPSLDFGSKSNSSSEPVIIRLYMDGLQPDIVVPTSNIAALYSSRLAPHNPASFLLSRRDAVSTSNDWFSGVDEVDLVDWVKKINYVAAYSTYYVPEIKNLSQQFSIRRRKSTPMASSNSAPAPSQVKEPRLMRVERAQEEHLARKAVLADKLSSIDQSLKDYTTQLDECTRESEHLKLLVPILPKTRENVIHAATKLYISMGNLWASMCRLRCYRQYLSWDLETENATCEDLKSLRPSQLFMKAMNSSTEDFGSEGFVETEIRPINLSSTSGNSSSSSSPQHLPSSPSWEAKSPAYWSPSQLLLDEPRALTKTYSYQQHKSKQSSTSSVIVHQHAISMDSELMIRGKKFRVVQVNPDLALGRTGIHVSTEANEDMEISRLEGFGSLRSLSVEVLPDTNK